MANGASVSGTRPQRTASYRYNMTGDFLWRLRHYSRRVSGEIAIIGATESHAYTPEGRVRYQAPFLPGGSEDERS